MLFLLLSRLIKSSHVLILHIFLLLYLTTANWSGYNVMHWKRWLVSIHPILKNESFFIIYSPSCCSRPIWFTFFCGTQNTFNRMSKLLLSHKKKRHWLRQSWSRTENSSVHYFLKPCVRNTPKCKCWNLLNLLACYCKQISNKLTVSKVTFLIKQTLIWDFE